MFDLLCFTYLGMVEWSAFFVESTPVTHVRPQYDQRQQHNHRDADGADNNDEWQRTTACSLCRGQWTDFCVCKAPGIA